MVDEFSDGDALKRQLEGEARCFFADHKYSQLWSDIAFGRHHRHATDKVAELMADFALTQRAAGERAAYLTVGQRIEDLLDNVDSDCDGVHALWAYADTLKQADIEAEGGKDAV